MQGAIAGPVPARAPPVRTSSFSARVQIAGSVPARAPPRGMQGQGAITAVSLCAWHHFVHGITLCMATGTA